MRARPRFAAPAYERGGRELAELQQEHRAILIDLTLNILVLRLMALVFIVAVHGAALAATAVASGDAGPRHDGRLTLNPLAHLDLLGTLSGVLFLAGWMKPMAIDPKHLRLGRVGLVLIILAATGATLASIVVLRLLRPLILPLLPDTAAQTAFALIDTIGQVGLWFALLNLLPIPCLTGGHLLVALVPRWRASFHRAQIYCAVVLLVLAGFSVTTRTLGVAYSEIAIMVGW